jgi:potassium-transporting ATPase KdpC subunit
MATKPAPPPTAPPAGPKAITVGPAPPSTAVEAGGTVPEPPFRWPSWRPAVGLLLIFVLLGGVLYPLALTGFDLGTGSFNANGKFVAGGNATELASELIGQNITNNSLFWLRPSLDDYNATVESGESPYGPTDPNLVNLTEYYIAAYGLNNTTAPIDLVSNSESGFDPDLTVPAALVQIPRVAAADHLTQAYLTTFVDNRITQPVLGFIGAEYVNVIDLDTALLQRLSENPPSAGG